MVGDDSCLAWPSSHSSHSFTSVDMVLKKDFSEQSDHNGEGVGASPEIGNHGLSIAVIKILHILGSTVKPL